MSNAAAAPESCDGVGRSGRGWRRRSVRQVDLLAPVRSEEHTSELQSQSNLVCRLLLEKKKKNKRETTRKEQIRKNHHVTKRTDPMTEINLCQATRRNYVRLDETGATDYVREADSEAHL